uniref:RDHE2 dehydrogenase n=1 Tax=Apteryx owenii TaxID=8824 RepID=A0A8B9PNP4_APTOW
IYTRLKAEKNLLSLCGQALASVCLTSFHLIHISFMQKNFPGEVVLITGAANGIGRQIALNFALWGATLVLWDIDEEGNKETSRLAQENGAKRVFAYQCDCSNREEVYEQVRKEVGDVSILINNAGILLGKIFCGFPDTDFEKTLRVIFLSQVWTCKVFLPAMIACNHGHLISVANAAEFLGVYKMSVSNYCKFGLLFNSVFLPYCFVSCFTRNELLLPIYDTEYVASKIMDAIQKEKFYLIMPLTLCFLAFKIFIPRKMLLLSLSYLKISNSLDKLIGLKKKD